MVPVGLEQVIKELKEIGIGLQVLRALKMEELVFPFGLGRVQKQEVLQ